MRAFIIFRDRVTYARRCMLALRRPGVELDVVVVDQGSTWPAAVTWLAHLERNDVQVLYHGGGHPRSLWAWQPFLEACGQDRYVVTDCDVIPSDDTPRDWPDQLSNLLDRWPQYDKAALGLRLDRIPPAYQHRAHVLEWEQQFWENEIAEDLYMAAVDTTLAMYRPQHERPSFSLSGMRTGHPYVADHVAWYEDLSDLDEELTYYHEHAEPGISYWTVAGRSAWGS